MKLSLEIPNAYLHDFTPLTDLDFVLAHKVLENEEYADFYLSREKGRELILDNSMHELGGIPLSPAELEAAAKRCNADFVVAPDRLGEPEWNLEQFKQTHRLLGNRFKIAVCAAGRDPSERGMFIGAVGEAQMLCFPYREPRLRWFWERSDIIMHRWKRIHLLGVSSLSELPGWTGYKESADWSVDTRKPIKWGILRQKIDTLESLRGGQVSPTETDSFRGMDCSQMETTLWNIAYLRRWIS